MRKQTKSIFILNTISKFSDKKLIQNVSLGFKRSDANIKRLKTKRATYLQSEAFFYKQATSALQGKSKKEFINALYLWFDVWRVRNSEASISSYLLSEEETFFDTIFKNNEELTSDEKKRLKQILKKLRFTDTELKQAKVMPLNLT